MKNNNKLIFFSFLSVLGLVFFLSSCEADTEIDQTVDEILSAQPTIESFSPQTANIQTKVTVTGTNLNFAETAFIGGVECTISQRVNSETLEIEIAPDAVSGPIKIVTSAEKEAISQNDITVTYPTPSISSDFPDNGEVNQNITIEGENLEVITRIAFGETEGTIQFQESLAMVVSIPNSDVTIGDVRAYYNTNSGESSILLKDDFEIVIPTPNITNWPSLTSRDNEVTITGDNLNLVNSLSFGGETVTFNTLSSTSLSFNIPANVATGYHDIVVDYGDSSTITQNDVPHINGQYESYIEFDAYDESVFTVDASKDPLAVQQLNGVVAQPSFPGDYYYNLEMNTGTGSTIGRMKIHEETTNTTLNNILDAGNFGDNPVLHFWINTEGTEPIFKIYIGGTSSDNRRELSGSNTNTGNQWKLYAVRLNGFIPSISSVSNVFEIRLNTGSSQDTFPVKINLDWFIVTDSVLTEFGAEDVTDLFKAAG